MASKVILTACAVALFVQMGTAQLGCGCNTGLGLGLARNGLGLAGTGLNLVGNAGNVQVGCGNAYVGSGGGLGVTTYSPIAPAGVSIRSDNGIEGPLELCGGLPVLSAVNFEGQLGSRGQSGVQYSCGNSVGITTGVPGVSGLSGLSGANLGYSSLTGASLAGGLGYGAGLARGAGGCGCGCGV